MTVRLRPAEAVAPGHPDRLADSIADTIVEVAYSFYDRPLVGVEVAVHRHRAFITGTVAGVLVPMDVVEREVLMEFIVAGYGREWGPTVREIKLVMDVQRRHMHEDEHAFRECSADQSITTGYAVDRPETGWMPPEHWLARQVMQRVALLRRGMPALGLGPDGKVAVVCAEPSDGGPVGIDAVTVSIQQRTGANDLHTRREILAAIREAAAEARSTFVVPDDLPDRLLVNGAGDFERGGTNGDNGLSGKKLVVDAYGPRVPIGGGALAGKDFFKVDRAGAIIARRLALAAVRAGAAPEATVELFWRPGDREGRITSVVDGAGAPIPIGSWADDVDRTLVGNGDRWPAFLRRRMRSIAREGHFGSGMPWDLEPT